MKDPTKDQAARLLDLLTEAFGEQDGVEVVEMIREAAMERLEDAGAPDNELDEEDLDFLSGAWLLFELAHQEIERRQEPMPIADAIARLEEIDVE
jgi:hypothetical protein